MIRDKFMGSHCHVYISPYARTRQTWKSVKSVLLAGGGIDMTKQTPEMVERQLNDEAEEEEEALRKVDEEVENSKKEVTARERKRLEAAARRKTKKGKRVTISTSQYEDDLIEQNYGNLAGVATISDAEHEKKTFGRYFYRYPNGERVADVVKRTDNFMKTLREQWDEKQNLLVVTHGVTFRAILLNLCQDIPGETNVEKYDFFSNPGNCTTVAFKWPRNRHSMGDAEWNHQDPDHDQHEKKKLMARALGKSTMSPQKSARKGKNKGRGKSSKKQRKGSDSESDSENSDESSDSEDSDKDSDSDEDSVRHGRSGSDDDSDEKDSDRESDDDSDEEKSRRGRSSTKKKRRGGDSDDSDDSDDESHEQTKDSDSSSSDDDL
jgi:broad specificity phosphatase PhoE